MPVLLALLTLLACWKLGPGGRIIARGDLLLYFYPLRDFAAAALRDGTLPLWNPYTFMGAPFLANSQAGVFYPPNIALSGLPVERAVAINIVLHLLIATIGAYVLVCRGLGLARPAAFASALAFGLGGYLGAQIEHLNQLQVLAWLPWCAWGVSAPLRTRVRVALLSALIALQLAAGHTQSLYIACVGVGLIAVLNLMLTMLKTRRRPARAEFAPLFALAAAALLAALIASAQLLPTLELSRESFRAGGLPFNEAGAFSWRPWVIARALLPTYGDPLFPEYIAYIGVSGLALALHGALSPASRAQRWLALALTATGLLLALGVVTPVFNVLYKVLPGFNLFRAQARWLVLFALGAALLIGLGVQALTDPHGQHTARRWLIGWLGLSGCIAIGLWLGARISPEPEYQTLPARGVLLAWAGAWLTTTTLIALLAWRPEPRFAAAGFAALFALEMFAAAQFQPYNRATDAGALRDLRPAVAHLRNENTLTEGRVLALSGLFFDPGDKREQEAIFAGSLSADEIYDRLIASKHKEILSPNLPLLYRIASVDGYDGGLLPTRRFVEYTQQFASDKAKDGRLREFLKTVPDQRWLGEMGVRYIVADKTQDVFIDGVFYDLLFSTPLTHKHDFSLEPYDATAMGLVFGAISPTVGSAVATVEITFDNQLTEIFTATVPANPPPDGFHTVLRWNGARRPLVASMRPVLAGAANPPVLRGITLIDARDNTFSTQIAHADALVRLVYSGDVKIYHFVSDIGPRAFVREAPLTNVQIEQRTPEQVRLTWSADPNAPQTLVLRDSCYPGWIARAGNQTVEIRCTDTLFREVVLPAGVGSLEFEFAPASVARGIQLSLLGLAVWIGLFVFTAITRRRTAVS